MSFDLNKLLGSFRNRFDELDSVSDETVTMYLEDALVIYAQSERAVIYLAAHLYVVDKGNDASIDGGMGVVTSDKTGKKQNTYKTQSERDADSFYEITSYGRKYLQFKRHDAGGKFRARVYG